MQHEDDLLDVFELVVRYLHPRVECLDEQRLQGVAFFLRAGNVVEGLEQVLRGNLRLSGNYYVQRYCCYGTRMVLIFEFLVYYL